VEIQKTKTVFVFGLVVAAITMGVIANLRLDDLEKRNSLKTDPCAWYRLSPLGVVKHYFGKSVLCGEGGK
jgi:hypothetical protein